MSLDSWLGGNDVIVRPPAKRQKKNSDTPTCNTTPPLHANPAQSDKAIPTRGKTCWQPPKYTPKLAIERGLSKVPPELFWGKRHLVTWSASVRFQGEEHVASLECLADASVALLGLDNGDLDIIECNARLVTRWPKPSGRILTSRHIPPGWPIVDIASETSHNVVCASKRGTTVIDVNTENSATFREYDWELTRLSYGFGKFALGGSEGNLGLLDTRSRNGYSKIVTDSHSTLTGPKASRQRPAVSSIAWASPHILASGSQANSTVKFWDIRYTRKHPVMSIPSNSSKQDGGINCIRSTKDGSVWALTRDARLLNLSHLRDRPYACLRSNALKISTPQQTFDLTPTGTAIREQPAHPLIASCSDDGIVMATQPSEESIEMKVDATFASLLRVPYHSSYPSKATSVRWHPFTSELVTVIGNRAWETWTLNDSSISYAKPAKISMEL